jgi:hypothetical protein
LKSFTTQVFAFTGFLKEKEKHNIAGVEIRRKNYELKAEYIVEGVKLAAELFRISFPGMPKF